MIGATGGVRLRLKPLGQRLAASSPLWGWGDQLLVSGASFAVLVMIARWTDTSQVGAYAICQSIIALLIAAQDSLVTRPYSVQLYRPAGTPAEHAFSALAMSLMGAVLASALLVVGGLAASAAGADGAIAQVAAALALAAPMFLLREFVRRYCFAQMMALQVFLLDLGIALLTVAALAYLGSGGQLTLMTALVALGMSCGAGCLVWLIHDWHRFKPNIRQTIPTLKQSWTLGKWLMLGQVAMQAQGYMTHWLSLLIAGTAATGVYAACVSIIAFSNPLLFGFFNLLTPKYVRILKDHGEATLVRKAARDAVLLLGLTAGFCVLVFAAGETVMGLLFHGQEYAGHGTLLAVLSLSVLASASGAPAAIAVMAMERGRVVAGVTAATSALNVVLVWTLMSNFGLLGAAFAMVAAELAGSVMRWGALLAISAKSPPVPAMNRTGA